MNVSLAHHWLVGMRGGERVLEQLGQLFPNAPIYTLVADRAKLSPALQRHSIYESPLALLPGACRHYSKMLPLFPSAARALRVQRSPQFLLTSDASVAKGLRYDGGIPQVCYCHSPARYLWGMESTYLKHTAALNGFSRRFYKWVIPRVRRFDYESAQRVTHFIANSRYVRDRIRDCYGRESTVIHPPVAVDDFCAEREPEAFYLIVSQLVSYKRIDLAVDAFNSLGKDLVVIGAGSEMAALRKRAKSNITFLGHQPLAVLKDYFERCRAFIFPGTEDFGITPLEAQAAGRPVIAFAEGGALETVIDGITGLFFREQSAKALAEAVTEFERRDFPPQICRENAKRFGPVRFRAEIKTFLETKLPQLFRSYLWPC